MPRFPSVRAVLRSPRNALVACALFLCFYVSLDVLDDPDIWWHLEFGKWILIHHAVTSHELFSYAALGFPLTDHEWLPELLFYLISSHAGLLWVALFCAVISLGAFVLIALTMRIRSTEPLVLGVALLLGAKVAQTVLGSRPEISDFICAAALLYVIESFLTNGGKKRWWIPVIMLLWANWHAGFIAGAGILGLALAAEYASTLLADTAESVIRRARVIKLIVPSLVSLVAACVNPRGPFLYFFAIQTTFGESAKPIVEWNSPDFHNPANWPLLFLIITTVAMSLVSPHRNLKDAAFAFVGIALVLLAVRNITLAVVFLLPTWATLANGLSLEAAKKFRIRPAREGTGLAVATSVLILAIGVALAADGIAVASYDASPAGIAKMYPACLATLADEQPGTVKIFTPYGLGGYFVYRLYPKGYVYEYGESISLGAALFTDYLDISQGTVSPNSVSLLDRSGTTDVLAAANSTLAAELAATGQWHPIGKSMGMTLYERGKTGWTASVSQSCVILSRHG